MDILHMASVSKPFVAMAVLQLVEKGQVSLDSPLVRYLPYFTMADPRYTKVTIRQMLTHTSGFPDVKDYGWDRPQYDDGALERYIRDSVSHCTLLSDPGTKFAYSNMAYDVLAGVVAALSGTTFETLHENAFLRSLQDAQQHLYCEGHPAGPGHQPSRIGEQLSFRGQRHLPIQSLPRRKFDAAFQRGRYARLGADDPPGRRGSPVSAEFDSDAHPPV